MHSQLVEITRYGDVSIEACAQRLSLVLQALGMSQSELAAAVGFQNSSITNMVKARQFPSRDVMLHLYFNFGVDFNFMYVGDIAGLRQDLVGKLVVLKNAELKTKTPSD